jgi:hypothetical protein
MMLQNDQIWAGSTAQATDLPTAQNGGSRSYQFDCQRRVEQH